MNKKIIQFEVSAHVLLLQHALDLWVLELQQGKTKQLQLLYSWVVPVEAERTTGWMGKVATVTDTKLDLVSGAKLQCKLLRATFVHSGEVLLRIINRLLQGQTLEAAVKAVTSEELPALIESLRTLSLASGAADHPSAFALRPEVFLSPGQALVPVGYRPLPGPVQTGCFVTAAVDLRKDHLCAWQGTPLTDEQRRLLWQQVATGFQAGAGFDVRTDSARRVGNVEWFRWGPWHAPGGQPYVRCKADKQPLPRGEMTATAAVELSGAADVPPGTRLLVRCRLRNDWEAAHDQQRLVTWSGVDQVLRFETTQPFSGIEVAIWAENQDGGFDLQFEKQSVLTRTVQFNMGLVGRQFVTDTPALLTKTDPRDASAVKKLQQFSRTTSTQPVLVGDKTQDPWIEAGRQKLAELQHLFPPRSEGRFFRNGWDEQEQASGNLAFYAWLLELMERKEEGEFWLIDPFFDEAGVDAFARTTSASPRFRVLTSCQLTTVDDAAASDAGTDPAAAPAAGAVPLEPRRATRIRQACAQRKVLLEGIDLRIEDLRSAAGGTRQLFHDRYVLACNAAGQVTKGFHLSNSIQGATKSHPLLITPIPMDLLRDVARYVEQLRRPLAHKAAKQTEVVVLYPEPAVAAPAAAQAEPNWWALPGTGELLATLYNEPAYTALPPEQLRVALREVQHQAPQSDAFALPAPERLAALAARLADEQRPFEPLWEATGHFAANGHFYAPADQDAERPECLSISHTFIQAFQPHATLPPRLAAYLEGLLARAPFPAEPGRRALSPAVLHQESWEAVADTVHGVFLHWGGEMTLGLGQWPGQLAAGVLAANQPAMAVDLAERLLKRAAAGHWNHADPRVQQVFGLGALVLAKLLCPWRANQAQVTASLLRSRCAELRAAGVAMAFFDSRSGHTTDVDAPTGLPLVQQAALPDDEYRLGVAHALANLPHERRSHVTDDAWQVVEAAHRQLTETLVHGWTGDQALLKRVVRVVAGRMFPERSAYVSWYLLVPLVQQGSLPAQWPFDFWLAALQQKVLGTANGLWGSAATAYQPAERDGELSATVLYWWQQQAAELQLATLQTWGKMMKGMRSMLRLPLAHLVQETAWQDVALRFAWLYDLVGTVAAALPASPAGPAAAELLTELQPDHLRVQTYLRDYNQTLLASLGQSHQRVWEALLAATNHPDQPLP